MKNLSNILLEMAMLALCACGGATKINPSSDSVNFPIEGGEENVTISADGSWVIDESPEWISSEIQEDVLIVKTKANETGRILEGDIVLRGKDDVKTNIHVTQATICSHITPSSENVEFDKEGGTKTVTIDTDGTPIVEAPDGFTASYSDGTLTITAPANEAGSKSGEIKLTCDEQNAAINITQKGNICQRCKGTGKLKCTKCGGSGIIEDLSGRQWDGCRNCGGRGHCEKLGYLNDYGVPESKFYKTGGYRQGTGKMTCPDCGGSGH